jgi:hypothetical protein
MKHWKCPHCARTSETEDSIVMVICPACIDCSMEESENQIKSFDEGWDKQLCLRCFKKYALRDGTDEGDYYCEECIKIRKHYVKPKPEDEPLFTKRKYTDTLELWGKEKHTGDKEENE